MPEFHWSEPTARFRGPNGRFLSSERVRRIIDATLLNHQQQIVALTEQLRARALPVSEWERRMRAEIKSIHIYSALAAKGGRAQLDNRDLGRIGAAVKRQYRYLQRFAAEIASGAQRLDGRAVARATMYAQAGRGSYQQTRQREMSARGFDEEFNILSNAEHCEGPDSCVEQTARGRVPIGKLVPIGGRPCIVHCQCSIGYANSQTGEIAA